MAATRLLVFQGCGFLPVGKEPLRGSPGPGLQLAGPGAVGAAGRVCTESQEGVLFQTIGC